MGKKKKKGPRAKLPFLSMAVIHKLNSVVPRTGACWSEVTTNGCRYARRRQLPLQEREPLSWGAGIDLGQNIQKGEN